MFYHLNELYGMTKWFDKFSIFSLTEKHINGRIYFKIIISFFSINIISTL